MCLGNTGAHQSVSGYMHTEVFISVHKCQQENECGGTEPLHSLHRTFLLYYPFSFLFPLRQLFIIYPAGAINEKSKFCLCWLMQKPTTFQQPQWEGKVSMYFISWNRDSCSLKVLAFGLCSESPPQSTQVSMKSSYTVKLPFLLHIQPLFKKL